MSPWHSTLFKCIHQTTHQSLPACRASGLSPEFALLGFLSQSPAHGYELRHRLVSELGEIWRCSQSQTYNILARLEAQGFIFFAARAGRLPSKSCRATNTTPPSSSSGPI